MRPKVSKILFITLSNIGDVVMTLPVLQALTAAYPEAVVDVIVGDGAKGVFEGHAKVRRVTPYLKRASLKRKFDLLLSIRRERYDVIVDLRRSLLGLFGGARLHNRYLDSYGKNPHKVYRHLRSLKGILPVSVKSAPWWGDRMAPGGSRVIVAAVGSKSDIKKWPAESYAELLDKFSINQGCRIVLIGDKADQNDATKVKNIMKQGKHVEDLSGRTDFQGLVDTIKKASLVITNDSAPLHIADALEVPVLAIFGPTDPRKYGPRHEPSAFVSKDFFCTPCEKAQCVHHHECMKDLSVLQVYQKALTILDEKTKNSGLKILLIRLDRIGDVVLSLPVVDALKEHFPDSSISMMVRPYTRGIVEGYPGIEEVISYDYAKNGKHGSLRGNFRMLKEVVRRHFDVAFILNPSTRSYLLPFFAGIPYRVGFQTRWPGLLTASLADKRHEGKKHESEYTLDVVRAFGVEVPSGIFSRIPIWPDEEASVEHFFAGQRMIAVHAGASCPSKRWPRENFKELCLQILQKGEHGLLIVGGEEEAPLGDELVRTLGVSAKNLCGKLSLRQLAAVLKKCDLLISNDSGPVHIAAAVGTKTVTIFGRNREGLSPDRWKARGPGHRILQKDVGCVICLAHRCTIGFECLKVVRVDEVFEKVQEALLCGQESARP